MLPPAREPAVTYRIDREGKLIAVAGFPDAPAFVGRSLRSLMSASGVMNLCHQLAQRARQGGEVSYRFRCDAPAEKRWFLLEAKSLENGEVEFKSSLLSAEQRPRIAWLELPARHGPAAPLVALCSWCGAVRAEEGGRWDPIEVALEQDPRIGPDQTPRLTHGICPSCEADFLRKLKKG
ncbi:MAG: hypothetical protein C0518_11955 [Opitutus sp.]|nr:hypothetical protein [Opitutus sp.]